MIIIFSIFSIVYDGIGFTKWHNLEMFNLVGEKSSGKIIKCVIRMWKIRIEVKLSVSLTN